MMKKKGFVKNKIVIWHKNDSKEIIDIKLECGEKLLARWTIPFNRQRMEKAKEIKKEDLIAELRSEIDFNIQEPHFFELLQKKKYLSKIRAISR